MTLQGRRSRHAVTLDRVSAPFQLRPFVTGHATGLGRVLELTMTGSLSHEPPAIIEEKPNPVTNLHEGCGFHSAEILVEVAVFGYSPLSLLRAARASDIPAIQRVRASVKENRLVSTVITDDDVRTAIEATGRGWVVEQEGEVVAFAIGNATTGNIWALFVHPEYEGHGYGRQLHDTMVDWLWAAGLDRLWLTTDPGTRAQRFYEAAGWRLTGTTDRGELQYELLRR